jgi:hypothetical protein
MSRAQAGLNVARSRDGLHIALATPTQDKKIVVVVDGQTGPEYDEILCSPVFTADGVEYLDARDGWLLRCRRL